MHDAVNFFAELFSYPFMVRAFLVGTMVALCSSLLGVSLVLKRYAMIGDGLSHVGFGALALAKACNVAPLTLCIPVVTLSSVLLLRLNSLSRIRGDAAIALISTGALAAGVMILSLSTGMNTDVFNYLFGSILSMTRSDVLLSTAISVAVLLLFILCYNRIFAVTFDTSFARATGTKAELFDTVLALLTSLVIVVGMRMMGAMLISSLIVLPALSAMRMCRRFKTVVISSALISVLCLWTGLLISYVAATPTGASIVACNLLVFAGYCTAEKIRKVRNHEK
ncbi:MAG: metal ABC transporter permease [Treponema sp.]|nr:metal ABC transporter permease [Treponema sp.]